MLPILGLFWLATKAVAWVDGKNPAKQVLGKVLFALLGAVVLYLMYAFVEALIG
ncbi:hypothetical protein JAO73_07615 [Hymenobacter sp. BT523]|uniref:hypothetical protein n=1 Tax=Hymenobacter sp. BT523 TaxID=2795725 RepID=UPI0018EB50CE|nr:hypothetical protein [Hymenobacter sp. BT523]MBJ6108870.1 hypothetical protein [Hymenobacter sp. BT523]